MKKAYVIDFDGTITLHDVTNKVMEKFAADGWREWDNKLLSGEINIETAISEQFKMINGDLNEILSVALSVPVRDGFDDFLKRLDSSSNYVICVSAGLSFVISEFIKKYHWNFELYVPETIYSTSGTQVIFPDYNHDKYVDFKEFKALSLLSQGYNVIYFGDGSSDINGAKHANLIFAVKNSSLAKYCKLNNLNYREFESFSDIKF